MRQVTEIQFVSEVLAPSAAEPIAVLFTASWCGPCKVVKPRIERLSAFYGFEAVFVDAGEEKALAGRYGVRAVPSLVVFSEGLPVAVTAGVGNLGEADLINFLNKHGFDIVVEPELEC